MGIEIAFQQVIRTFPAGLREIAGDLPDRLGLPCLEGRHDRLRFPPNGDLPLTLAEELMSEARDVSRFRLRAFRQAHSVGLCAMLLAETITAERRRADRRLLEIRKRFVSAWEYALAAAVNSDQRAKSLVARSVGDWQRGAQLDRLMLHRRRTWKMYPKSAWLKLRWAAQTVSTMVAHLGMPERAALLMDGYTCFLFALQCRDDANAASTNESHPLLRDAIQLSPGALLRAAPLLGMRAAEVLRLGGFPRLARSFDQRARSFTVDLPSGDPLRDQIMGMSIAQGFAELDKGPDGLTG